MYLMLVAGYDSQPIKLMMLKWGKVHVLDYRDYIPCYMLYTLCDHRDNWVNNISIHVLKCIHIVMQILK